MKFENKIISHSESLSNNDLIMATSKSKIFAEIKMRKLEDIWNRHGSSEDYRNKLAEQEQKINEFNRMSFKANQQAVEIHMNDIHGGLMAKFVQKDGQCADEIICSEKPLNVDIYDYENSFYWAMGTAPEEQLVDSIVSVSTNINIEAVIALDNLINAIG